MYKLAAYEMLLEDHPLWDKVASEKGYSGSQVAGAALGTGLGGAALGYGAAEEASRGKVNQANRAASRAKADMRVAEGARDIARRQASRAQEGRRWAESARDIARQQARRATSDANFYRGSSKMWRDTAMNIVRRRGR